MTQPSSNFGFGLLKRILVYALSSGASALIAVITVMFSTRILNPVDYGLFAVGIAVPSVAAGVAAAGSGYGLQVHLPTASGQDRVDLVSTALCMVGGISLLLSAVMAVIVLLLPLPIMGLDYTEIALVILAAMLGSPWLVATEVLTLEGRAGMFSAITIGNSFLSSAATLTALFHYGLGGFSLFIGPFVGAAFVCLGSFAVLHGRLGWPRTSRWFLEMAHSFWPRALANLFEHGQMVVERWLLASFADLRSVGIFNHAQQYRTYTMQGVNAVSRGTWPGYLEEARENPPRFRLADETWRLVHIGVFLLGLVFAFFGGEILEILTNGKFVAAHPYATLLLLVLLVQASGKSQMTLLIARNHGHLYANLTTASIAVHVIGMAVLVPFVGMAGLLASIFLQVVFLRAGVYWAAGRIARVPFSDEWVAVGIVLVPLSLAATILLEPPLELRLFLFAVVVLAVLFAMRKRMATVWRRIRSTGMVSAPDKAAVEVGSPADIDERAAAEGESPTR